MSKITEALTILKALGLPRAQQNERSALTLLALADLTKDSPWSEAKSSIVRIHDILVFVKKAYQKRYAENTRETIRRQTIHQFEQGGLVIRNPDDPSRPTNSPNNVYQLTNEILSVIRKFGTKELDSSLEDFISEKGKLIDRYEKRKKDYLITVQISNKESIHFSPGKHNRLQARIIEEFKPTFCPKSELVYVGDAARKLLYKDDKLLSRLKIPITEHNKLPDVVLYDPQMKCLFLVEAVTAHGPVSAKRQIELEQSLKDCPVKRVYISAFPDFKEFKRHTQQIAWDTEVWIRDNPDHMIHFNGPKFFTIYGR